LADFLAEDSVEQIASAVRKYVAAGKPAQHRSEQVRLYRERIAALDTSLQIDPLRLRQEWTTSRQKQGAQ